MEDKCKITIIYPLTVTRADGLEIKLLANSQYCFEEEGYFDAPFKEITDHKNKAYGYKVISGASYFIVFDRAAVQENFDREGLDELSLAERAREDQMNKVADHKKETLKILGHDIKAFERVDYNGRWLQKTLEKRYKPGNAGKVD